MLQPNDLVVEALRMEIREIAEGVQQALTLLTRSNSTALQSLHYRLIELEKHLPVKQKGGVDNND